MFHVTFDDIGNTSATYLFLRQCFYEIQSDIDLYEDVCLVRKWEVHKMEGKRYISFAENNTRLNSNLDMILFNQFLKQDLVGDQPHLESGCPIFENPQLKRNI